MITALGAIYGIVLGTLIGTVGLTLAGVAGYLLMSTPVRQVIERALKGRSPEAIAALSDRAGPWGIALSPGLLGHPSTRRIATTSGDSPYRRSASRISHAQ